MAVRGDTGIYAYRTVSIIWFIGVAYVLLAEITEYFELGRVPVVFDYWALSGPLLALVLFGRNRKLVLAAVWAALIAGVTGALWDPRYLVFAMPIATGVVGFSTLFAMLVVGPERRRSWFLIMIGSLILIGQQIAGAFQQLTTVTEETFDNRAYLVDLSFGFNALALASRLNEMPMADALKAAYFEVIGLGYMALMLITGWMVMLQLKRQSPRWLVGFAVFVLSGTAAGLLYHVFPAAGPAATYGSLLGLPDPRGITPAVNYVNSDHVRNCMPSIHFAWALLVLINARGLPRVFQVSALLYVGLTFVATLVMGEHYLVDLVVAVPFAIGMQGLACALVYKQKPGASFCVGTLLTAFWFYALVEQVDWFLAIPGFTVGAACLTLLFSAIAFWIDERSAAKRLESSPQAP